MSIRIGHASRDENSKARGGNAGDQTGKEVCIRNWYSGGWEFLARAKDETISEKIAAACEAGCGNNSIGYDQNQRNTLNTQARAVDYDLSKIETACETDCSAFVSVCVQAAGVGLGYTNGNAPTTRTLKSALNATDAFDILTGSGYLNDSSNLRRGDILVKAGSHCVIVLDDGENATVAADTFPLLKKGCSGRTVQALQILLIGFGFDCGEHGADGRFGSDTESAVMSYQKANALAEDGEVGPRTWAAILGIR